MSSEESILISKKEISKFKKDNSIILKKDIQQEIKKVTENIPENIWDKELSLKVEQEVNLKLEELNESIEVNPEALYYSLKSETSINPEISEYELTLSAYKFLEQKTSSKFLKKILKEKAQKLAKEKKSHGNN